MCGIYLIVSFDFNPQDFKNAMSLFGDDSG
jgi:hypothetical protein